MAPNSPQSALSSGGVTRRNFPRIRVKLLVLKAAGGRQAGAGGGGNNQSILGMEEGRSEQDNRGRGSVMSLFNSISPRTAAPRERQRAAAPLSAATAALSQAALWQRRDQSHSASVCVCVRVCVPLFFCEREREKKKGRKSQSCSTSGEFQAFFCEETRTSQSESRRRRR